MPKRPAIILTLLALAASIAGFAVKLGNFNNPTVAWLFIGLAVLLAMGAIIAGVWPLVVRVGRVVGAIFHRRPVIVYENFDEYIYAWKSTKEDHTYVHLWFHNKPTGGPARDAAAKLSWWDIKDTGRNPLFSVDGKWQEAEATIDLLPNGLPHGLDLFIRKPTAEDWSYGCMYPSFKSINEAYRLNFGIVYKVKVTISCEGYFKDFWFRVTTGPTVSVHEFIWPDGDEASGFKDELRH
jgi:hypothetical protein